MALGGGNGDSAEGASAGTRSYFPLASGDDVEAFQSNGAPVSDRRQRATAFASALNVCKNCIGSAVLTLPFAFRQSGLAAGLVQLAIVHVGSAAGFHFIAEATILEGASDTRQVAEMALNSYSAGIFIEIISILYSVLSGSAFFNIVRSYMPELLHGINFAPFLQSPLAAVLFASLVIAMPLSLGRDLAFFARFSFVGVIALVLAFGVLLQKAISSGSSPDVVYGVTNARGLFKATPIINLCCSMHYNSSTIALQMVNPSRLIHVTLSSFIYCFLFYTLFGVCAYLLLGQSAPPNVLDAFKDNDSLASTARIALLLSVVLTWPLIYSSSKNSLRSLLFPRYVEKAPDLKARIMYGICIVGFQAIFGTFVALDRIFEIVRSPRQLPLELFHAAS